MLDTGVGLWYTGVSVKVTITHFTQGATVTPKQEMERVTVQVEPQVKREFAIACIRLGVTMSDILRAAMLETIERSNEQKRRGDAETEV